MEAAVYRNNIFAGMLIKENSKSYIFRYEDAYFYDEKMPAISLTLSKKQQEYRNTHLFPFFFNLLAEGANKAIQCRQLKIDEDDYFSLLLATGGDDTIGAVNVNVAV